MTKVDVLGCAVDCLDIDQTVDKCEEAIATGKAVRHVAVNAAKLVLMRSDEQLAAAVGSCDIVSADGQAVVWAARLLGRPLPGRVAGIDLMHRLLDRAATVGYRVFILGAHRDVLLEAIDGMRLAYPGLVLAGARDGYFTEAESVAVCSEIRRSRSDILFVAMSSPKKEYWLASHGAQLGVPLMVGVGGAIDIIAGRTSRAPVWIQRAGLEWLYRFAQEPRRMWRRYLIGNSHFIFLLTRDLVLQGRAARDASHRSADHRSNPLDGSAE